MSSKRVVRTSDGLAQLLIRHGIVPTINSKRDVLLARKFMPITYTQRLAEIKEMKKEIKWISVDDKLPTENSMVVAAYIYEYSDPDVAICNFYGGRFCLNTDGLEASNYDGGAMIIMTFSVTHWMLLPKPPIF